MDEQGIGATRQVTADAAGNRGQVGGSIRTALENAMVALFKENYGKGPTAAKAWLLDDYVFVALENGLARNEETLVAAGREQDVRRFRMIFEETVRDRAMGVVAEIVGRNVLTYHSQIVFGPTRSFEIFVLEPQRTKA